MTTEMMNITTGSLVELLTQGAVSKDRELLETAFSVTIPSQIQASIEGLSPELAMPLLQALVERMVKRPQRAHSLVPWLRSLLLARGDVLRTKPDFQATVAPLKQLIESRSETLEQVMAVKGRLDAILEQSKLKRKEITAEKAIRDSFEQPMAVYQDTDSEGENNEGMDIDVPSEEEQKEGDDLETGDSDDGNEEFNADEDEDDFDDDDQEDDE